MEDTSEKKEKKEEENEMFRDLMNMNTIKEDFMELGLSLSEEKNFGIYTSEIYRSMFLKFSKERGIETKNQRNILILSGMVNNKDRVLDALDRSVNKNQFTMKAMTDIRHFSQYVSEHRTSGRFPFVKLNTTFPEIAFIGTILQNADCYEEDLKEMNKVLPRIMRKTHMAQFDLDSSLQNRQKAREKTFWDETVLYSRNKSFQSYDKGFHEQFYLRKEADKFNLLSWGTMSKFKPPYSIEMMMLYAKEVMEQFNIGREKIDDLHITEQKSEEDIEKLKEMVSNIETEDYNEFVKKYSIKFGKKKVDTKREMEVFLSQLESGKNPNWRKQLLK